MSKLEVRPLHPGFGVEVIGLEPAIPLADDIRDELRRLFDAQSLLLIRDIDADFDFQNYLSLTVIGKDPLAEPPMRRDFFVSNKREGGGVPYGELLFHSDSMWRPDMMRCLSLYGVEVDEPSTPTFFVSNVNGWETAPAALRARVEGLSASHSQDATHKRRVGADVLVSKFEVVETISHPIAHVHPDTGRTMLYASQQMTLGIDGLDHEASEDLLDDVFAHLYAPENRLAHVWRTGDLLLWDNIALQHARPNVSLDGPTRTLRKVFAPAPTMLVKAPEHSRAGA